MADDLTTKPTLETLLQMMRDMREETRAGFAALEIRLDRIEGAVHDTQSKFHLLRADFNEFKGELREHFPAVR